ncbi:MAG: O-antigen ligase family protein [Trichodesmium sp.]
MKELLKDPLILILVLLTGIIFSLVTFQLISQSKKLGNFLETLVILSYIISFTGPSILPFSNLNPMILAAHGITVKTVALRTSMFAYTIVILWPVVIKTLKKFINIIAVLIILNPLFFIFIIILLLSFSWSETPKYTLNNSLVILAVTIFAAYIAQRYTVAEIARIFRFSNTFICITSIYYSLLKPSVGINVVKNSWQGILAHPNPLGSLMALNAGLWMFHAINYPQDRKISIIFCLLSIIVLFKADTGGGKVQLVLLIAAFIYLNFIKTLPPKLAFTTVLIFMVVFGIGVIILTNNWLFIIEDVLGKDATLTGRTPLWSILFSQYIPQRPLLGYGFHGFWQSWRGLENPAFNINIKGWTPPHSHNGFIDLTLDFGLIGITIFLLSLLTNITLAVSFLTRNPNPESILPLALVMYIIIPNLSETALLENGFVWLLYSILTIRLCLENTIH